MQDHYTRSLADNTFTPEERAKIIAQSWPVGRPRPTIEMIGAVIYARESDPNKQDSIPRQLKAVHRYFERLGIPVIRQLEDGQSGLEADRPAYQELLRMGRERRMSHVGMIEAKRFGQNAVEFITSMRALMAIGIEIHDTRIGQLTPEDVGRIASEAHGDSLYISQNVTQHMALRAEEGAKYGRPPGRA